MRTQRSHSRWPCNPRHYRRGGAAVEFALVLPVLMTLVLGVVDFARIYSASMALHSAARVGAEQGATHRLTPLTQVAWENRVRTTVIDAMQCAPQFDSAKLTINTASSTNIAGQLGIEVSTEYPFQTIVNWPGLPSTVTLRSRVVMEQYR